MSTLSVPGASHCTPFPTGETYDRFKHFVKSFVECFEETLILYRDEAKINKATKPSNVLEMVGSGLGAVGGLFLGLSGAGDAAGAQLVRFLGEQSKAASINKTLQKFLKNKDTRLGLRKELVDAGVDIFATFENQFTRVVFKGGWHVAMSVLAREAVERIMNFLDDENSASDDFLTKGVILGKSKRHLLSARTVNIENGECKISDLYENVGLIIVQCEGSADKYYKKNKLAFGTIKYGHRPLFKWESSDNEALKKNLKKNYKLEMPPEEVYIYNLSGNTDTMKNHILNEINDEDPNLKQDRLNKVFNSVEAVLKSQEMMQLSIDNMLADTRDVVDATKVPKPVWFDIRKPVTNFTALTPGREEKLNRIASSIQRKMVVISGPAGVGKTELSVYYANKYYTREQNIVWLNAETRATLKKSLHCLSVKLGLSRKLDDRENTKFIFQEVCRILLELKTLLIFDNVDTYNDIKELIPKITSAGSELHVLFTSRNSTLFNPQDYENIENIDLGVFSKRESNTFINKALDITEGVEKLSDVLGYLPLALQHAVAYIRESNFTVSEYVATYQESEEAMSALLERSDLNTYDKSIFASFKNSFNQIEKLPAARSKLPLLILHIMSYLSPDNIPREMFLELALESKNETNAAETTRARGKLNRAIYVLKNYSIINSTIDRRSLCMHRLIQQVLCLDLQKQNKQEETLEQALRLLQKHMTDRVTTKKFTPHIISVWNHAYKYDNLVERFIINFNKDKTVYTTFFPIIAGGCSYKVISKIVNKGEQIDKFINSKDRERGLPVHYAVTNGGENILGLLIRKNADVNARKMHGLTPLHLATENGYYRSVEILLKHGAKVTNKTQNELTPLHFAAKNGYADISKLLIDSNAKVNATTRQKYTPLHFSVKNNHFEVVKTLLECDDTYVNAQTNHNDTALHLAVETCRNICEVLLEKNADVNIKNKRGDTPLHLGALKGNLEIINILLNVTGTRINSQTITGHTALHLAAQKGNLDVIKVLLGKGADIGIKTEFGFSPLHLATQKNHLEVVNYFLNSKCVEINAQAISGDTPLHMAAEKGHLTVVKALLAGGADANIQNMNGDTALDLAHEMGHLEVENYILQNELSI